MTKWLALLFAGLCVAATAFADDGSGRHVEPRPVQPGSTAPAFGPVPVFNAPQAGLETVTFPGRPQGGSKAWILSFFATWCPGCVNEMPVLQRLQKIYAARGLRIVTIGVDREPGTKAKLQALIQKNEVTSPVILDPEQRILHAYQGRSLSLPYLYVVGPDGKVALVHEGFDPQTEPQLRHTIEQLLK